nr:unknown [Medicago truncatula]
MSGPSREENSKEEVKEEDEGNRLLEVNVEGESSSEEEAAYESGEKIVVVDFEFGTVDDSTVPPFS